MKRVIIVAAFSSILWFSCERVDAVSEADAKLMADTAKYTTVQWMDTVVSFGTVNKGEQVNVTFRFRNTGTQPLILANVRAACGCTIPDYTKGAVAPGGEGEVTGAFDTNKSQSGEVRKSIFVTTNTKNKTRQTLIFTGLVKEGTV
ncbi:MAG: hypothetical protein JWQ30_2043, partial [Sediminibacterium sp.]|nr:hypothetical protein [Sediminibacterium sp.]